MVSITFPRVIEKYLTGQHLRRLTKENFPQNQTCGMWKICEQKFTFSGLLLWHVGKFTRMEWVSPKLILSSSLIWSSLFWLFQWWSAWICENWTTSSTTWHLSRWTLISTNSSEFFSLDQIYQYWSRCWSLDPRDRPFFSEILAFLNEISRQHEKNPEEPEQADIPKSELEHEYKMLDWTSYRETWIYHRNTCFCGDDNYC